MDVAPNEVNMVDFGAVQVNDRAMKVITIANSGKFPFDFKWDYQRHPNVTLSPGIFSIFLRFSSLLFKYFRAVTHPLHSNWNSESRG